MLRFAATPRLGGMFLSIAKTRFFRRHHCRRRKTTKGVGSSRRAGAGVDGGVDFLRAVALSGHRWALDVVVIGGMLLMTLYGPSSAKPLTMSRAWRSVDGHAARSLSLA